jgi:EpsI family protein
MPLIPLKRTIPGDPIIEDDSVIKLSTTARALVFCACLISGAGIMLRNHGPAVVPPRELLSALPMEIDAWSGRTLQDLSENAQEMLRVDDYINRAYIKADGTTIGLYIGYHTAGGFHSPLNCLPGSGWISVTKGYLDLPVKSPADKPDTDFIHINRIIILKGADKQIALYWYQGCGRVIASEYWGLLYGMLDRMRRGRTDAALVRILCPADSLEPAAEAAAEKNAADFAIRIHPLLSRYLPN